MQARSLHPWEVTPAQAIEIQRELASDVREEPLDQSDVRLVAGADLSFDVIREPPSAVVAGFVTLALPDFELVERYGVRSTTNFPYIPGLLSFREVPPLLDVWERLTVRPDALLVDGHGRAHPRRFGYACHLGMALDLPAAGVAKSLLVGSYETVADEIGAWSPIVHHGETVGAALRTRTSAAPVYVSVGYRIDLPSAIDLVMRCRGAGRIPEPTRRAHLFVNALRRGDVPPENAGE